MAKFIELDKYKRKIVGQKKKILSYELHSFLDSLSTEWEGVTTICNLMKDLSIRNHTLGDISYVIGEDPRLFFWSHVLLSFLSLEEMDQLIETLRECFPEQRHLIEDMKFFYVTHQYEKLGIPKKINSKISSPIQEGHA